MTGRGSGLASAVGLLACPHCRAPLAVIEPGRVLGCANGHRFDVARQGHVSLLGPRARTDTGDTAAMVAARERFLGRGHYAPVTSALAEHCDAMTPHKECSNGELLTVHAMADVCDEMER